MLDRTPIPEPRASRIKTPSTPAPARASTPAPARDPAHQHQHAPPRPPIEPCSKTRGGTVGFPPDLPPRAQLSNSSTHPASLPSSKLFKFQPYLRVVRVLTRAERAEARSEPTVSLLSSLFLQRLPQEHAEEAPGRPSSQVSSNPPAPNHVQDTQDAQEPEHDQDRRGRQRPRRRGIV